MGLIPDQGAYWRQLIDVSLSLPLSQINKHIPEQDLKKLYIFFVRSAKNLLFGLPEF